MLVMTPGEMGPQGLTTRIREQEAAAAVIGAQLVWGPFSDGAVTGGPEAVTAIDEVVARMGADVIYAHAPHDTHQDHVATSQAALAAGRRLARVLFYQSPSTTSFDPTVFVEVEQTLAGKLAALRAHWSQVMQCPMVDLDAVEVGARYWGTRAKVGYAEAFETPSLRVGHRRRDARRARLATSCWRSGAGRQPRGRRASRRTTGACRRLTAVSRAAPADGQVGSGRRRPARPPPGPSCRSSAAGALLVGHRRRDRAIVTRRSWSTCRSSSSSCAMSRSRPPRCAGRRKDLYGDAEVDLGYRPNVSGPGRLPQRGAGRRLAGARPGGPALPAVAARGHPGRRRVHRRHRRAAGVADGRPAAHAGAAPAGRVPAAASPGALNDAAGSPAARSS